MKTSPAPKNETAVKKRPLRRKTRASRRTSPRQMQAYLRLRAARKLPTHLQVIVGARAKNRFRKLIRITGTRFTGRRKRRSGNWINGALNWRGAKRAVSRACPSGSSEDMDMAAPMRRTWSACCACATRVQSTAVPASGLVEHADNEINFLLSTRFMASIVLFENHYFLFVRARCSNFINRVPNGVVYADEVLSCDQH